MRTVGYRDAVRLLAPEQGLLAGLDRALGGALLGVTAVTGGLASPVLSLFEVKGEVLKLAGPLLGRLSDRLAGTTRYDRTQRLLAAHTVLVVTAFFEAFDELDLPFDPGRLRLHRTDQRRLAAPEGAVPDPPAAPGPGPDAELHRIFTTVVELPGAQQTLSDAQRRRFEAMAARLLALVEGLAVWDELTETQRADVRNRCRTVLPASAARRYAALYRRLAADAPEFGFWAGQLEHEHTRAEVRRLGRSLADLAVLLSRIPAGQQPDARRAALARAYRARLAKPSLTDRDLPDGLRMPPLGEAYLDPYFRVLSVSARPADESAWSGCPVRADLPGFLAGYLTGPRATEAPLMVLGQPGAGKSVLTQVLAARLPATDFLPVRVVLREVRADAELQDQIEDAIHAATGERLGWAELVRSAGDALPVVLLDGFDELLQATGVSQSDYLERVARFQEREADQGRPVAVLVTSRTAVADRTRYPAGSVVVRLEPFGAEHVTEWLAVWQRINGEYFAAAGIRSLAPEVALRYRELCSQPLLLQMLALYDAEGNALQRGAADGIDAAELYERLLTAFARREVRKQAPALPDDRLAESTERELQRLSLVAFSMFDRGRQWVAAAELDADLAALEVPSDSVAAQRFQAPLSAADQVLGRFFFIQRSAARRDAERLETYEFLHATFGEYLIARLLAQLLTDLSPRRSGLAGSTSSTVDDGLLYTLLSYEVLSNRDNILPFLPCASPESTERLRAALLLALRADDERPPAHPEYRPAKLRLVTRLGVYRANILLLILRTTGPVRASELWPEQTPRYAWRHHALQWKSVLGFGAYGRFTATVDVDQVRSGDRSDVLLRLAGSPLRERDLAWHLDQPSTRTRVSDWTTMLRNLGFSCDLDADLVRQVLTPLTTLSESTYVTRDGAGRMTASFRTLLDLVLGVVEPEAGAELYRSVLGFLPHEPPRSRVRQLVARELARNSASVPPDLMQELLRALRFASTADLTASVTVSGDTTLRASPHHPTSAGDGAAMVEDPGAPSVPATPDSVAPESELTSPPEPVMDSLEQRWEPDSWPGIS